ncbi:MAG: PP2C family protein-serine/threonine phosphatase, partial [Streptosporangiaceae bacterium]
MLGVGLALTGLFVWYSRYQYVSNEQRLLGLRVKEAAAVLSAAVPSVQEPLSSAAELAGATDGNRGDFDRAMSRYVGPGRTFVSASLWRAAPNQDPLEVIGQAPVIGNMPGGAASLFAHATAGTLAVSPILGTDQPRIVYAVSSAGFVVSAGSAVPKNHRAEIGRGQAFSDLNYALYLGRSHSPQALLETNASRLPLRSGALSVAVPFGDSAFTLVMSARQPFSGPLAESLPWILGAGGIVLSLAAALLAERLVGLRNTAEGLAIRQRDVAETLQHALLPQSLPELPGVEVGARYVAGVEDLDIGGDWYDLITLEGNRALAVVGDVSGRGLRAATIMAELRFAVRAHASDGDGPAEIVNKLSSLLGARVGGDFATLLCVLVDIANRRLTLVNAGHLPPLIIHGGAAKLVEAEVHLPVGVKVGYTYTPSVVDLSPAATVMMYTDGLVERRGEVIDAGLARLLQSAAAAANGSLDGLLD